MMGSKKKVLYYEFLLEDETIDSHKYYSQLKVTINENLPELVKRKNINRLHVSFMTKQNLLTSSSEIFIHPPYSPDIAS